MKLRQNLTNEALSGRFQSNFALVTYAIHLAENMVHSGRTAHVGVDIDNPAVLVIEEIASGKDKIEPIKFEPKVKHSTVEVEKLNAAPVAKEEAKHTKSSKKAHKELAKK